MRDPLQLLQDLGWLRFIGVQTMLLATVAQFACAPLLWSFWLAVLGMVHPIEYAFGSPTLWVMITVFILSATLNLGLSLVAVSGMAHRHLLWWVFTTPLYYPLGALAAFKALREFVISPFFWDKTQHGVTPLQDVQGPVEVPEAIQEIETKPFPQLVFRRRYQTHRQVQYNERARA